MEATKQTLTEEERVEVGSRQAQVAFYQRTASLLQSELNLFLRHLIASKGLDPEKQYVLNEAGELTERENG